ncbi:MAG: hypothetical protein ACI4GX_05820 [Ruminococcus sp.]
MFNRITLELSLKPFKQTDEPFIRETCRKILEQWRYLLKNRKNISFLLWSGDGSEILDYNGDLKQEFEWGYFMGTANLPLSGPDDDPALSMHIKKQLYMDNPPVMTYGILKDIVRIFKEEGKRAFPDSEISVGTAFDIGPEFSISDFKYSRHTEICSGTSLDTDKLRFVDSTALLNADDRKYAAYPDGIPQDTPFATFFGAQTKEYYADMGFDFIWLSNGLGFSADPWSLTGKIFDGERFYAEKLSVTAQKVFSFWKLFREACPDIPIETRGTNNSVGIDYATDGVPLYDIYNADLNILPPPNSPWAALNDNFGLEMMGHMSRVCELPGDRFLFRYYLHDPWWMNSPWYDRYECCAHDIYLPMSVTRIREDGSVQTAENLNIMTLDNSKGDMPDCCVYEPLPHLLKAEKDSADSLAFLVWLYPMKEYTSAKSNDLLSEMYYGDRFMYEAINQGFPLNYVVSTSAFIQCNADIFKGKIIVSPVIENKDIVDKLCDYVKFGGNLILYGSKEKLNDYPVTGKNVVKVDIASNPSVLREALAAFGYCVKFETQENYLKLPAITMVRSDNGLFLSAYNPDTTTDTLLKFPLGAPIFLGGETQLCNGFAKYRFNKCEHRECRIFVQQNDGIISAHEKASESAKYRRRFSISGLKDATIYYFPEDYCKHNVSVTLLEPYFTPVLEEGWQPIYDDVFGYGFKGEHQNGTVFFLMPFEKYL